MTNSGHKESSLNPIINLHLGPQWVTCTPSEIFSKIFQKCLGMVSDEGSGNPETAVHMPTALAYREQIAGWGETLKGGGIPMLKIDTRGGECQHPIFGVCLCLL